MKRFIFLNFLMAFLCHGISFSAPDAQSIVKKADHFRLLEGDHTYTAQVKDYDGSQMIRETRYSVSVSPSDKVRIETQFPERSVGRNFLMVGVDLWLQTPDIKRPTRISFQQRLTGEVANGDLARTNFSEDYLATVIGQEKLGAEKALKLNLKAKTKDVTYSGINYWVRENDMKPLKAEFLAQDGKVIKEGFYSQPKKFGSQEMITQIEFRDSKNKAKKSVLNFSKYKKANFSASHFNKDNLALGGR